MGVWNGEAAAGSDVAGRSVLGCGVSVATWRRVDEIVKQADCNASRDEVVRALLDCVEVPWREMARRRRR